MPRLSDNDDDDREQELPQRVPLVSHVLPCQVSVVQHDSWRPFLLGLVSMHFKSFQQINNKLVPKDKIPGSNVYPDQGFPHYQDRSHLAVSAKESGLDA